METVKALLIANAVGFTDSDWNTFIDENINEIQAVLLGGSTPETTALSTLEAIIAATITDSGGTPPGGTTIEDAVLESSIVNTIMATPASPDPQTATNTASITTIQGEQLVQDTNIGNNATTAASNASAITTLQGEQTTQDTNIGNNASSIGVNTAAISVLQGEQTTQDTNIGNNATAITTLQGEQTTQDASIAANTAALAELTYLPDESTLPADSREYRTFIQNQVLGYKPVFRQVTTTNFDINSTTLTTWAEMSTLQVEAGELWEVEWILLFDVSDATADLRFNVLSTGAATGTYWVDNLENAVSRYRSLGTATGNIPVANNADDVIVVKATVNATATGVIELQVRNNSGTSLQTFQLGSIQKAQAV